MAGGAERAAEAREGADPPQRRARAGAAGAAVGARSSRSTASRRTTGRRRWRSSSTVARSCSSTTSCSGPTVEGWPEAGCPGCSYTADSLDGAAVHLPHHDVTFVAVSRAPARTPERVQAPHGLGLSVGLLRKQLVQPRFRRVHRGGAPSRHRLQLRHGQARRHRPPRDGAARPERVRARGTASSTTRTRPTTAAPTR